MLQIGPYEFKEAETEEEFQAIHHLNYLTFVVEIPQHQPTSPGMLVDKFHAKNRYLIAQKEGKLVGMLALHDQPPFSITDRLPDPGLMTSPGVRPIEIRLLAVVPEERKSPVMSGLVWLLSRHAEQGGYTHFVISGVVEQQEMYTHMGFEVLGPPVGSGKATYIPMWLSLSQLQKTMGRSMRLWQRRLSRNTDTSSEVGT